MNLIPEDFDKADWDILESTAARVLAAAQAVGGEDNPAGDWAGLDQRDKVQPLMRDVEALIVRLEAATKRARAEIGAVEYAARLASFRRRKSGERREVGDS